MSLYAAQPARRSRQILTDVLYVVVLVAAVWLSLRLHDAVLGLTGPTDDVGDAGRDLGSGLQDAGDFLGGIPLIGDEIADEVSVPFDRAAAGADSMASAGDDASAAIERLAFWLAVVVALVPILGVSVQYLPGRIGFVREASALRRLGGRGRELGPAELDLLALRALTREPIAVLRGLGDDVAARWRDGDPAVVRELANLELRACGVRPTTPPTDEGSPPPAAAGPRHPTSGGPTAIRRPPPREDQP
ncbi:hypothetical protein [Nocardioides sp. CFH 31398]|uniref:hypothetical protein n=1 Tax=Nocardioides sp. CFH 31398 TaxID=2919579 RepID=UPI001F054A8C|nr:hypothetical protein [Nocardioides sp. CFH 31398]MCH1866818.1 hypothetical protein [Nocardioides sp. CFH 31398]